MTGRPLFPVEAVPADVPLHAPMCPCPVVPYVEAFGVNEDTVPGALSAMRWQLSVAAGPIVRQLRPPVLNRTTTGLRPPSKWWAT
ncbi:hypothetical protein [Rhodococcus opacus]|uniref:hypothetical protein n=1 Tax=Rhodococcus opacus TaxID=37919 RepID=UPI001C47348A|nr:hypothetical protein [Rhodococcus opacus]MBV6758388.1 hypothetical protein [Rhodococcus opacus]